jgi:chloramphenicol 3-O phosphotransferase
VSPTHVIILNGVGSVGKSAAARALRAIAARPFLHVAMDAFIGMLPATDGPSGRFDVRDNPGPWQPVHGRPVRPVLERAMRGMRGL